MSTGSKIIDGLKDAVAGNFTRVHVEGFEWVRADHVASLTAENERLRSLNSELQGLDLTHKICCERLQDSNSKMAHELSSAKAENEQLRVAVDGVRNALFPADEIDPDGGHLRLSNDAGDNLEGALTDLEHQQADPVCIRTIARVLGQIEGARAALQSTEDKS